MVTKTPPIQPEEEGRSAVIHLCAYNINNGCNLGLEVSMQKSNINLSIFNEMKLTGGIYNQYSLEFNVVATEAPSQTRGGV